jgi:formylglycine-generating enzyme
LNESGTNYTPITFDWVTISAGEFLMGSDKAKDKDAYDDELPQHTLYLPAYKIARGPVTVAQFAQFVTATGCKTTAEQQGSSWNWGKQDEQWQWQEIKGAYWAAPRGASSDVRGKQNHPVTCVSWHDAQKFCAWAGVRLPSEAEWEKAARGSSTGSETGRIYPWGDEAPDQSRCNFNMNVQDTTAIGHYPPAANGLLDMTGNVREWTSSLWGKIDSPISVFEFWPSVIETRRTLFPLCTWISDLFRIYGIICRMAVHPHRTVHPHRGHTHLTRSKP